MSATEPLVAPDQTSPFNPDVAELESSLVARFRAQVAEHRDRLAVHDEFGQMSYGELADSSARVAQAVRGESPEGAAVAVLCGLKRPAIEAILGVLEAGCFYVPIDPTTPAERIRDVLRDSAANLVLCDNEHRELAASVLAEGVALIDVQDLPEQDGLVLPGQELSPDSLAYVIYTSGSTGRPKGVMQSHRNVLFDILRQGHDLSTTPDDRFGLIFPVAFSASVCHVFGALLHGAGVCLFDLKQRGLHRLAPWLLDQRISVLDINVATFRALSAIVDEDTVFSDMRMVAPGSEPVYESEFEIFKKRFAPGCLMQNALGTTETRTVTQIFLTHASVLDEPQVPIGWSVSGKDVFLLDPDGAPVPTGEVGEIVIRSRYLSPGYWNNEEATVASFFPDPAGGPERLYFTGDIGKQRADGCLVHLGRRDSQVKIRGNRVEISEVESAVARIAGVVDAAVVAMDDGSGVQQLVGVVAGDAARRPDASRLRRELRAFLPGYMIPTRLIFLDAMPVNANGKLDRLQLRSLAEVEPPEQKAGAPPETEAERRVLALWREVLPVSQIGVDEDFFDLGGDSLGALQVCAQLEEAFGRFLPLVVLSQYTTIREIAAYLERDPESGAASHSDVIELRPAKPGGEGLPPIFCIPGVGGHAYSYRLLLESLETPHPAYGLQFPGLDGTTAPLHRVEDLAQHLVSQLREIQAHGPYHLVGYSFGGLVVFEMARALQEDGERCELIAILDTLAPGGLEKRSLLQRFACHVTKLLELPMREGFHYLGTRLRARVGHPLPKAGPPREKTGTEVDLDPRFQSSALVSAIAAVRQGCRDARSAYAPAPAPLAVSLLRCPSPPNHSEFVQVDEALGWEHLARGGVSTYSLLGEHLEMFEEPYVQTLALRLREALQNAEKGRGLQEDPGATDGFADARPDR
jgi:amino acid adenylation domain-containing protein